MKNIVNGSQGGVKVAVIVLNWNGWKDTTECLESVFRSSGVSFQVVVCDNDSHDDSVAQIKRWASGDLIGERSGGTAGLVSDLAVAKPIPFVEYSRIEAESAGGKDDDSALVIINTGGNLGFAGGNNVGIRYCLQKGGFDYFWVLNNDTVIDRNALFELVNKMQSDSRIGICGSKLIFYHQPSKVQAWGGAAFDAKRGVVLPLGHFQPVTQSCDEPAVEAEMAYVVGASMLVSRDFVSSVGLMSEEYFLYFEEIDWAFRARGKFRLGYSDRSLVYHKEGGSIGSSSTGEPSSISTRYLYRNRVLFNYKYNRLNFVLCLIQIGFELLVLLKRRHFKTARVAFSASLSGFFGRHLSGVENAK